MARKRNREIHLYLSESEYDIFISKFSEAMVSPTITKSSYIRKCVLDKEITVIPGLRDVNRNLIDIIDELNTMNKKIRDGEIKDTGSYLKKINKTIFNIYEILNKISRKILRS